MIFCFLSLRCIHRQSVCYLQVSQVSVFLLDLGAQVEEFLVLRFELQLQSGVVTSRLLVGCDET